MNICFRPTFDRIEKKKNIRGEVTFGHVYCDLQAVNADAVKTVNAEPLRLMWFVRSPGNMAKTTITELLYLILRKQRPRENSELQTHSQLYSVYNAGFLKFAFKLAESCVYELNSEIEINWNLVSNKYLFQPKVRVTLTNVEVCTNEN